MRTLRLTSSSLAVLLLLPCLSLISQTSNLRQQIESKYAVSKPTADRTDIVTAGDVIVLQKDRLVLVVATSATPTVNFYKDGKIQQSAMSRFRTLSVPGQTPSVASRTFVAGEKLFLTGIDVKDDGVMMTFLSDPFGDNRFYGTLKFPFAKGATPPSDQVLSAVAEVLKVQPSDDATAKGKPQGQAPAGPALAPAPAPMAAIVPPPPPIDMPPPAPPTIAIGQTKDQVTAMFGPPTKVVKLPNKEVDYYPDMKVTFVHDKVANVQ